MELALSSTIRQELHQTCISEIQQRIEHIQHTMKAAMETNKNETKSSAGDKHETARAHIQLEQEKLGYQLRDTEILLATMQKIPIHKKGKAIIEVGDVVITEKSCFYIAVPLGKITVHHTDFFAVSPQSPIGQHLLGKYINDTFQLNTTSYTIQTII